MSQSERGLADRRRRGTFALVVALAATTPAAAQLVLGGNHRIFQNNAGGTVEEGDHFGAAFGAGDFNRDGYSDLAIGAPDETVGSTVGAGAVYVVYGSASGLGAGPTGPLVLHQDVAGVQNTAETEDRFGAALAALDVNGDGWDDLAVGIPGEDVDYFGDSYPNAGGIQVFLGSVGGLVAAADTYIDGGLFDDLLIYTPEAHGNFGFAIVGCDENHDGFEDLLVGAPGDSAGGPYSHSGRFLRLPGSAGGITTVGAAAPWFPTPHYRLGAALACRILAATGYAYSLVGLPDFTSEGSGSEAGGTLVYRDRVSQGFLGPTHAGAHFGSAVALGDFKGLGVPQALNGAPGWSFPGPIGEGGLVWLSHLTPGGPEANVTQDTSGVADDTEGFDHFGAALAVADFDRDGYDDAVIGAPDENFHDGTPQLKLDVGVVHVLFGGSGGLSGSGSQYWSWDVIEFGAVAQDRFGSALAVGDFDGNGVDDLAIGAPGAAWSGQPDTGIVQILYAWPDGWIFGDDFEGGNAEKWSP